MKIFKWFNSEVEAYKKPEPLDVKLPDAVGMEGKLDTYSPTWQFINKWAEAELIKARESNDFVKLPETKTSALRGRIKLLKEILNLPERTK